MTMQYRRVMVEDLQSLFHLGAMGGWSDRRLLTHFVEAESGRESAFRVLIHRHGPMVLSVCRRVLGDPHAAEDAFQATFLLLVQKATAVRGRESLAGWLYEVAQRLSRKARSRAERRKVVEGQVPGRMALPDEELDRAEVRALIDEEIRRLPQRYREPFLLCYTEGLRHHEIAQRLECPVGTVESRLSRARDRLRSSLARKGLAITAGIGAAALLPSKCFASVPAKLVESTARSAVKVVFTGNGVGKVVAWATLSQAISGAKIGSTLLGMVACGGLIMAGLGFHAANSVPDLPNEPPSFEARQARPDRVGSPPPVKSLEAPSPMKLPVPSRSHSAFAVPLVGIKLDGRLDDWPKDLERYPIRQRLANHPDYDPMPVGDIDDPQADFMAGYDPKTSRIYLAVVVRDDDALPKDGNPYQTDAVEIYVDGLFSEKAVSGGILDATKMPVIQYVGVPGPVPAYKDPRGLNPSLMYGDGRKSTTEMAFNRVGNVTTYEWAVQPFDHYPDQPTALKAGQRIGLDVVVVDKDRDRKKPAWLFWGPQPTGFKGWDAGNIGELILIEGR
ncbi:sigma-70 family RNA polymerase sigma factor [Tundrisphaera lichenicola]|uniref:sigma-70 family RNA polymerase sigma factor n=1 Tax=Tundrisphaera lichenicola TaxID=2029860 RepID=UPI003EBA1796